MTGGVPSSAIRRSTSAPARTFEAAVEPASVRDGVEVPADQDRPLGDEPRSVYQSLPAGVAMHLEWKVGERVGEQCPRSRPGLRPRDALGAVLISGRGAKLLESRDDACGVERHGREPTARRGRCKREARRGRHCRWRSPFSSASASRWRVLGFLWALYSGYRELWMWTGWTRPFVVDDITMPSLPLDHRRALRSGSGRRRAAHLPASAGLAVHRQGGGGRLRGRQHHRLRAGRARRAVPGAPARLDAVRRRLADDPDPRDRADGRGRPRQRLDRRVDADRLASRLGDRRVPHVLPGDGEHRARARVGRSPGRGADAELCLERVGGVLEAAAALVAPLPLRRVPGCGDRLRRRCDRRRAAVVDPGRSRRRDHQLQPVLRPQPAEPLGDEPDRGVLGIGFFLVIVGAEKLFVHRPPERFV